MRTQFGLADLPDEIYWKLYEDQRGCWPFGDSDTEQDRTGTAEIMQDGAVQLTNEESGLYIVERHESGFDELLKKLAGLRAFSVENAQ